MDSFEIARLAGVSRKTVQRVLNNYPNVKPETRRRIIEIMERNHYLPNASARKLSSKKTNTIGLFIIQDASSYRLYTDDHFFGVVIGAIISQASVRGYKCLVSILDISDTEMLFTLYKQKSIDAGIMISWSNLQSVANRLNDAGFLAGFFLQNNVDHPDDEILVPIMDERKGAYDAISYLFDLGFQDIAIIAGDMGNLVAAERFEGYLNAFRSRGLETSHARIYYGDFTEDAGKNAIKHWMAEGKLPEAIVCMNDSMAFGAIKVLREYGIDIPGQISIIGFDDLLISEYMYPRLTTMRVPRVDMSVSLVNRLIDRLENIESNQREPLFQAQLIVRDSCASSKFVAKN